ncbi:jg25470, partial [Pararge aegeria aegeria]
QKSDLIANNIPIAQYKDQINIFNDSEKQRNKTEQTRQVNEDITTNVDNLEVQSSIRPGMVVDRYIIEIRPVCESTFEGTATIHVSITNKTTIGDPIVFQIDDLTIESIRFSVAGGIPNLRPRFYPEPDDGVLIIIPSINATLYTFRIEYTGLLDVVGNGIYRGENIDEETFEDVDILSVHDETIEEKITDVQNITNRNENRNDIGLNNVRPGQSVFTYNIELTREDGIIHGKAILDVRLTDQTIGNLMKFNVEGLQINNVQVGVVTIDNLQDAALAFVNNNVLEVRPQQAQAATYIVVIEYTITLGDDGAGIFLGQLDDDEYIAMNLHPNNARRVFPCMDEPNLLTTGLSFTFNDMGFDTILSNTQLVPDST